MDNDNALNAAIGEQIARIRLQKGRSQRSIAMELGYTPACISMYEKGQRNIPMRFLQAFADMMEVDVVDILTFASLREKRWMAVVEADDTGLFARLPDAIVKALHIKEGDSLSIEHDEGGIFLKKI